MGKNESLHSLDQILQVGDFVIYTDLINAMLDPNKLYTKSEVWEKINAFLEKEVD